LHALQRFQRLDEGGIDRVGIIASDPSILLALDQPRDFIAIVVEADAIARP